MMEETVNTQQNETEDIISQQNTETTDVSATETANTMQPAEDSQPETHTETEAEPQTDYSEYTREQLVEALRELLQYDISQIRNRVLSIKQHFDEKTAALKAEMPETDDNTQDTVGEMYNELYNQYRKKRQTFNHELETQRQHNLELKKELLDELRALINSDDTLKKAQDNFNSIQEKWKSVGEVPRNEINNLWNSYHFLIEQFFAKVKINKELRDKDLKTNLEQKIAICEKAEALIMEPSVNKAFKQVQELREQWRETGPVPSEQNEDVWKRFRTATEKIDERRREHYANMKVEMEQNLLAKTELCENAEALANFQSENFKEWGEKTTEMEGLLKIWKSIGPVPREHNDGIWQRFTAAMSKFYENKKEHIENLRSEQTENYNRKIDLCLKAEYLAENTDKDWYKATNEILKLQKEWKEIGSTNKKQAEEVWGRFRAACNNFFARKTEFYNARKEQGSENTAKKQAIIEELKKYPFDNDNTKNLEVIHSFRRRWNEIGYTPNEDRTKLQQEFTDIINSHIDKLKIDSMTILDAGKSDKNGHISPELARKLQDEIAKLKNEVSIWENNIGFLANSKQATLLKEEFDKKIQSARQKIALMEAKLKMDSKKGTESEKKTDSSK